MSQIVQPLGSRVLVRMIAEENVTSSGLYVPDTAKEKPQKGEVVAIGDDTETIKVSIGDVVLFPKYTGAEFKVDGQDHLIIESTDLLAILRSQPAAQSAGHSAAA